MARDAFILLVVAMAIAIAVLVAYLSAYQTPHPHAPPPVIGRPAPVVDT